MKYSAGIKNISFWLLESKLTAEYILDGLSKDEILDLSLNENIYQVESQYKVKDIPNRLYTRLKDFSDDNITLELENNKENIINFKNIAYVKLNNF